MIMFIKSLRETSVFIFFSAFTYYITKNQEDILQFCKITYDENTIKSTIVYRSCKFPFISV